MHYIVGKTWDFPESKNKHKPIATSEATDDLHVGKDSWTYGIFSESILGAISFKLYLLSMYLGPGSHHAHAHEM